MTLTIKYFGMIAEMAGVNEEIISFDEEEYDLEALKERCFSTYELSDTHAIQIAVNQSLATDGSLKHGDEVAFLPPFSGG